MPINRGEYNEYVCDVCGHKALFEFLTVAKGWCSVREDERDVCCPECNPWIQFNKEPDPKKLEKAKISYVGKNEIFDFKFKIMDDGYISFFDNKKFEVRSWVCDVEGQEPYLSEEEERIYIPKGAFMLEDVENKKQYLFMWNGMSVFDLDTWQSIKLDK